MNEIMQLLQNKVGLSEEQSRQVVQVVANHLQSKLPESMYGMVMPLLGTQGSDQGGASQSGGLAGMLGSVENMFGKKS